VKTKSGATAVQFVYLSRRGSRDIEHLGSAHDEAELRRWRPRRGSGAAGARPGRWACGRRATANHLLAEGRLLDALERAYLVLGHAISGRQLAHDLFRRVLLPR